MRLLHRAVFHLLLLGPIACLGSSGEPVGEEPEVTEALEPAAVPQLLPAGSLGFVEETILPDAEPTLGVDPAAEPELENPNGVNGELAERPDEPGHDFTNLGDLTTPVPPDELLQESVDDPNNALPAL